MDSPHKSPSLFSSNSRNSSSQEKRFTREEEGSFYFSAYFVTVTLTFTYIYYDVFFISLSERSEWWEILFSFDFCRSVHISQSDTWSISCRIYIIFLLPGTGLSHPCNTSTRGSSHNGRKSLCHYTRARDHTLHVVISGRSHCYLYREKCSRTFSSQAFSHY